MAVQTVDAEILGRICAAARAYLNVLDDVGTDAIYGHQQRRLEEARSALDDLLAKAEIFQS